MLDRLWGPSMSASELEKNGLVISGFSEELGLTKLEVYQTSI